MATQLATTVDGLLHESGRKKKNCRRIALNYILSEVNKYYNGGYESEKYAN